MALHQFDENVAKEIGIIPAILYRNIKFWCEHNRANNMHFYDGRYWTFNSVKAYKEMFSYLSEKQIREALTTLEKSGYIATGNFNKASFDHTKWYADLREDPFITEVSPICPTGQIELTYGANGNDPQGKPIPNINTNNKLTDVKKERKVSTFDAVLDSFDYIRDNSDLRNTFLEFIKMRKLIKKPLTDFALKKIINESYKLGGGDTEQIRAIVEQSVMNSWQGVFPLKEKRTVNKTDFKYVNPFTELLKEEGYE